MTYSIIQKSQIEGADRIDADYYKSQSLVWEKSLLKYPQINEFVHKIIHPREIKREYSEKGILILMAQNVKNNFIQWDVKQRMPNENKEYLKSNLLKEGDVVVVRSGANYADTSYFEEIDEPVYANADVLIVRPKNIDGRYLATFLNTTRGRGLLKKSGYGAAQPHITPHEVASIRLPVLSDKVYSVISNLVQQSSIQNLYSKNLYRKAGDLLLKELGLSDHKVSDDLTYVVNYSDVEKVGRVDADYFQPKYQQLISLIQKNNPMMLGNLVSIKKGFEPGSEAYEETGKVFIRVSSLSQNGIEVKDQRYLSEELYNKLKDNFQPKVGEILLTKDATPGISYVVKESIEGIISGGILRLKVTKNIDAEYLCLCINSVLGKMQMERDAGGSIIKHWKPEQVKKILIPVLPIEIQQKISDLVIKSHEARKKSKELLEEAKRKVEEMIEKGN